MMWMIATTCFVVGSAVGALLFKVFLSDAAKVLALKQQLQELSEEYEAYKSSVHKHFGGSAKLLDKLTASYREVYMHMAEGASSLCPDYISSQLTLSKDDKHLLNPDSPRESSREDLTIQAAPPRDYAEKADPEGAGSLSEKYGIDRA